MRREIASSPLNCHPGTAAAFVDRRVGRLLQAGCRSMQIVGALPHCHQLVATQPRILSICLSMRSNRTRCPPKTITRQASALRERWARVVGTRVWFGILLPIMLLAGCAGGPGVSAPTSSLATSSIGTMAPDGTYQLSPSERGLDCRRLTGRAQVRILQVRDRMSEQPSTVSKVMRWAMSLFGGSNTGVEPGDVSARTDVAMLKAYNGALAEKGCPTFDLASELKPNDLSHTPRPVSTR